MLMRTNTTRMMTIIKGYLYVGELGCQIGVLQHAGPKKYDRLDTELTEQAVSHDVGWDT